MRAPAGFRILCRTWRFHGFQTGILDISFYAFLFNHPGEMVSEFDWVGRDHREFFLDLKTRPPRASSPIRLFGERPLDFTIAGRQKAEKAHTCILRHELFIQSKYFKKLDCECM
jgi:hypothetical protein